MKFDEPQLSDWLSKKNQEYRAKNIIHKQRPFLALSELTAQNNLSIPFNHPISTFVFEWFKKNSPSGAHQVGSVYTGVLYFDSAFWPVEVPIIFGEVILSPSDSLQNMPALIKHELLNSSSEMKQYTEHWLNCIDYGYGSTESSFSNSNAAALFNSAQAELCGGNSLLLDTRSNPKAILSYRLAAEIFFKAILFEQRNFTEKQIKDLNHDLATAHRECSPVLNTVTFSKVAHDLQVFPPFVSARYESPSWDQEDLWAACRVVQAIAAETTRLHSTRNLKLCATKT